MDRPSNEIEFFRGVAGDNRLRQWLEHQRTEAVRVMAEAVDLRVIGAAQEKYRFASRQLDLLEKAKSLR